MSEHAGTSGQQPEFVYRPGRRTAIPNLLMLDECSVFPWGISWESRRYPKTPPPWKDGDIATEHYSARWEDIITVEYLHNTEWTAGATGAVVTPTFGITEYYCQVKLADGTYKCFGEKYRFGWPVAGKKLKPVPGITQHVNVKQLARLLQERVAR